MAKRFAAHFGSLDNLSQLASMGFTEAGIVSSFGSSPSPAGIHNAGIPTATLNIFNDGSSAADQPGAAGGQWAGYFQSLVGMGWNMIGGEGVGGSVVGTIMNYCTYCNYGGIVGDQQANMYASPWDHPASGGHGHVDYIETYDNSSNLIAGSCEQSAAAARSAGAQHLGILIGTWMQGVGAQTYINILDAIGGDTILFWGGFGSASSSITGLAQELINHYGAAKGGAPATSGSASTPAAKPKVPVIKCPCRHMWIGFRGVNGNSTSQHVEFKVQLVGVAGWVDDNEKWIANKPYTGKLELWCRSEETVTENTVIKGVAPCAQEDPAKRAGTWTNPDADGEYQTFTPDAICPKGSTTASDTVETKSSGKNWKLMDFYPDKKGNFAIYIGSDAPEVRHYNVRFADKGTSPPYQVVME